MRRTLRLLLCAATALPAVATRAQAQDSTTVPWVREVITSARLGAIAQ